MHLDTKRKIKLHAITVGVFIFFVLGVFGVFYCLDNYPKVSLVAIGFFLAAFIYTILLSQVRNAMRKR